MIHSLLLKHTLYGLAKLKREPDLSNPKSKGCSGWGVMVKFCRMEVAIMNISALARDSPRHCLRPENIIEKTLSYWNKIICLNRRNAL